MVEQNASIGIILVMIALLSINLGVVNILPFPALDG
jgi:membrane-associated protease RseP (regulator of RpoE activity)